MDRPATDKTFSFIARICDGAIIVPPDALNFAQSGVSIKVTIEVLPPINEETLKALDDVYINFP